LSYIRDIPEEDRLEIARRARDRVLRLHSSVQRARELEHYVHEVRAGATAAPEPTLGGQLAPEGATQGRV
jgi:hypothetical protein